jgi:hypothetical protein
MPSWSRWRVVLFALVLVGVGWFNYANLTEVFGSPYNGLRDNMDKFGYGGIAVLVAIDVAAIALLTALIRRRAHRSRPEG